MCALGLTSRWLRMLRRPSLACSSPELRWYTTLSGPTGSLTWSPVAAQPASSRTSVSALICLLLARVCRIVTMPAPLQPATLGFLNETPYSEAYGDVYHSAGGGPAQAEHVFLRGNGLPQRWAG